MSSRYRFNKVDEQVIAAVERLFIAAGQIGEHPPGGIDQRRQSAACAFAPSPRDRGRVRDH
jgi:hypothetical protein